MPNPTRSRRRPTLLALPLAASLLVTACTQAATEPGQATPAGSPGATASPGSVAATTSTALFDSSVVHSLALTFDEAAYDAMIAAYRTTGDKEWIEATVTIDGAVYERAGIRLKGNSSLRSLDGNGAGGGSTLSSDDPETLPWLVDLAKYVGGQAHLGVEEFVVRSNTSATALNEAVALELLELAGLAAQDATPVRLAVNGGEEVLRLVVEHPDDEWMADTFGAGGALYKAESTGDWSYRGTDESAYDDVFDQEAGTDDAGLEPLIGFLEFINDADDATFAAEIATRLDVDAFATYLAMQELVDNFDDIDGPGNNAYLYWDAATGRMTVVPWDYNLAFGARLGGGGVGGGPGGAPGAPVAAAPGGLTPPDGMIPPDGVAGGIRGARSNVLVTRFEGIEAYATLVASERASLEASLVTSGTAAEVLATWTAVLEAGASDLVDPGTIQSEADAITRSLDAG